MGLRSGGGHRHRQRDQQKTLQSTTREEEGGKLATAAVKVRGQGPLGGGGGGRRTVRSRHQFCGLGVCQDLADVHSNGAERRRQGRTQGGERTTTLWRTAGRGRGGVPGAGDNDGRGPDDLATDAPPSCFQEGGPLPPPIVVDCCRPTAGLSREATGSGRDGETTAIPSGGGKRRCTCWIARGDDDTVPPSPRDQGL